MFVVKGGSGERGWLSGAMNGVKSMIHFQRSVLQF